MNSRFPFANQIVCVVPAAVTSRSHHRSARWSELSDESRLECRETGFSGSEPRCLSKTHSPNRFGLPLAIDKDIYLARVLRYHPEDMGPRVVEGTNDDQTRPVLQIMSAEVLRLLPGRRWIGLAPYRDLLPALVVHHPDNARTELLFYGGSNDRALVGAVRLRNSSGSSAPSI